MSALDPCKGCGNTKPTFLCITDGYHCCNKCIRNLPSPEEIEYREYLRSEAREDREEELANRIAAARGIL